MSFDLMEWDLRSLTGREKHQIFSSSFKFIDEILPHTHIMFDYILLRECTIKLSSYSRKSSADTDRSSHIYLIIMGKKKAELIDTETFFHHEKYISRERKAHFSHIYEDRGRTSMDMLTHSL